MALQTAGRRADVRESRTPTGQRTWGFDSVSEGRHATYAHDFHRSARAAGAPRQPLTSDQWEGRSTASRTWSSGRLANAVGILANGPYRKSTTAMATAVEDIGGGLPCDGALGHPEVGLWRPHPRSARTRRLRTSHNAHV
jgi:hypothetical protein